MPAAERRRGVCRRVDELLRCVHERLRWQHVDDDGDADDGGAYDDGSAADDRSADHGGSHDDRAADDDHDPRQRESRVRRLNAIERLAMRPARGGKTVAGRCV